MQEYTYIREKEYVTLIFCFYVLKNLGQFEFLDLLDPLDKNCEWLHCLAFIRYIREEEYDTLIPLWKRGDNFPELVHFFFLLQPKLIGN